MNRNREVLSNRVLELAEIIRPYMRLDCERREYVLMEEAPTEIKEAFAEFKRLSLQDSR